MVSPGFVFFSFRRSDAGQLEPHPRRGRSRDGRRRCVLVRFTPACICAGRRSSGSAATLQAHTGRRLHARRRKLGRLGFNPACAGTSRSSTWCSTSSPVHPRSCGEYDEANPGFDNWAAHPACAAGGGSLRTPLGKWSSAPASCLERLLGGGARWISFRAATGSLSERRQQPPRARGRRAPTCSPFCR